MAGRQEAGWQEEDDDDDIAPDVTWKGRIPTPPSTPGVHNRARQGKAEGIARPNKALLNHVPVKCVENVKPDIGLVK
jgi:hypothetical protein